VDFVTLTAGTTYLWLIQDIREKLQPCQTTLGRRDHCPWSYSRGHIIYLYPIIPMLIGTDGYLFIAGGMVQCQVYMWRNRRADAKGAFAQ